jgi:hypothetical protein
LLELITAGAGASNDNGRGVTQFMLERLGEALYAPALASSAAVTPTPEPAADGGDDIWRAMLADLEAA